jgi:polysaccharide deacetylase family protein (PEP-CTERM system associated)
MTVDVEEHFQVSAFEPLVRRADWDQFRPRVEGNVDRILELFDRHGIPGTFFVLGWIAERHPAMVRRIAAAGHEIASHGWDHVRVNCQDPEQFRADVRRTKALLEDVSGAPIKGYRAASFSISPAVPWAHRVLAEEGYSYSSSIYPIRHDLYGAHDGPAEPYSPQPDLPLIEIPVSATRLGQQSIPCGGGGYFRLLPYSLSRWAIARVREKERRRSVFYFHPWEIDPQQPRPDGLTLRTRVRHYTNLAHMERRLARVLADFDWGRMDHVFGELV